MMASLALDIRFSLSNPRDVCQRLGLIDGHRSFERQSRGVLVRCPWHEENTPSCSVTRGADGTIRVRCHGCGESGDLLTLIAAVHRLDVRRDFRDVLRIGADLAGIDAGDGFAARYARREWAPNPTAPANDVAPVPERDYPPLHQVAEVWGCAGNVADDPTARALLEERTLDVESIDDRELSRVLPPTATLPWWARFRRRPWTETGHRLLLPVYDAQGTMRSLRAWRITSGDTPKRLPPAGCKARGLLLADLFAVPMLSHGHRVDGMPEPLRIIITEGEPDFLTWAIQFSDADKDAPMVLGVVSGSWTTELAARIPEGAHVIIRTDHDTKGDLYAADIARSLADRCCVRRSRPYLAKRGAA